MMLTFIIMSYSIDCQNLLCFLLLHTEYDKTHSLVQERSLFSNLHRITGRWKAINTRIMSVRARPDLQHLNSRSSRKRREEEALGGICACRRIMKHSDGVGCLTRCRGCS